MVAELREVTAKGHGNGNTLLKGVVKTGEERLLTCPARFVVD